MKSASLTSGTPSSQADKPLPCSGLGSLQMTSEVSGSTVSVKARPGVHDPLDELLVGARDLGRQRDPHALHQRPTRDEPAGVDVRARQPGREHLQRPQLLMRDLPVRPVPARNRAHRQPDLAFAGAHQNRFEDLREHHRVVEGIVRLHLRDAPVARPAFPAAGSRCPARACGSARRCTSPCLSAVRPRPSRPRRPGTSSRIRRCGPPVCGRAARLDELADDVAEARLARQHLGGQPVYVGGPGIDAGVQQAVEAPLDVAVVAEGQCRDADDPSLPGAEAGGLHVDDGPACAGLRPPAGPRSCRSASTVGSRFEDGTAVRQRRIAVQRVGYLPLQTAEDGHHSRTGRSGGRCRRALGVTGHRPRRWRDDRWSGRDGAGQVGSSPARRWPSHGGRDRHERQVDDHQDDRGRAWHAGTGRHQRRGREHGCRAGRRAGGCARREAGRARGRRDARAACDGCGRCRRCRAC